MGLAGQSRLAGTPSQPQLKCEAADEPARDGAFVIAGQDRQVSKLGADPMVAVKLGRDVVDIRLG